MLMHGDLTGLEHTMIGLRGGKVANEVKRDYGVVGDVGLYI